MSIEHAKASLSEATLAKAQPPVLALMGPTAIGKSALALRLAHAIGGEIINCDSVQLYRGFDIGSAKPNQAQREGVPHHLLDVADTAAPWDAMQWAQQAHACIDAIRARGKTPIICGGTGLYVRALRDGLVQTPADAALRAQWQARELHAPGTIYAELQRLDPDSAAAIDRRNPAHLLRALEISLLSGAPASQIRQAHKARGGSGQPVTLVALRATRPWLQARMAARIADMLAQGLIEEVRALLAAGARADSAPMRAVGYREVQQLLAQEVQAEQLPTLLLARTWHYARRQLTWLRREPVHAWLDAELLATLTPAQRLQHLLQAWRPSGA